METGAKGPGSGPTGGEPAPVFRLTRHGSSIRTVRSLVPILRQEGVVILPTDTIYGLSARFDRPAARTRIRALKGPGRPASMVSLVSGLEMAFRYAEPPRGACHELLMRHWPSPLTAVLRARAHVPTDFCGPGDTLAFRWPVSAFLQALLGAIGVPLVSTSANRTGEPTPSQFAVLERMFGREVDALVDGGDHVGEASTIVDMTGDGPVVLRAGAIPIDAPFR